ncbi:MAG: hypothetical protein J3R72DRAFT_363732, partial [Linnemannia gamsii]
MKGPSRSELSLDDSNLEWIEQHHRTTSSRKAPTTQKSLGQNLSQNQQSAQHDFVHSGDESDYAEKQRQSIFYPPDPHKRTKEYHIEQAIGAIKLLKAASKPEGWKKVFRHKSDCVVSQSTGNGDKHPAFKGEHVIRGFRAQDVFSIVGVRKLWDDWYDQLNCVESYDEATNLMYMVMKGNMSSKTRDISMVERIEVERDGTIYFASCSVESNKIPLMSGKVRADIFVAGWIIQPLPSNPPITKVTYVIQTDLLSRLPKFIARRALAKRPLVIATIETHLKKNGVPMIVPRAPKTHTSVDTSLPQRPSSMAFAAYGMRSPSAIMEARRHSTLISRSSSFAPRHSHAVPIRGSPSISLQGMNRSSMIFNSTPNALKRHSTAPSLDSNRSSTLGFAPVLVLPHRHSETARKALAMFKVLASSPEDRWKAVSSDGTFKSYSRVISGAGLPMLRAEGVISGGWTVEQINAVIESSGCRQIWDERFDNLSIAETFNSNEYLFHVALQGIGSLTGRDLAGVTIVDRDPQTAALCNVSTSVLDSTIPEDPGRIRALLELSGWSLRPTFDGQGNTVSVNVTFVIQIDIRGTLPISVVKSLTASMMTAVFRLNQFINKTGYPPYASHISGTRLLDTFDPKSGFYELCY